MKLRKLSLRTRIFIAMIFLVVLASVFIAIVAIYQYNEEAKDYHEQRLERKEKAIKIHLKSVIKATSYEVSTKKIPLIFKDELNKIADIHSQQINLYDLEGNLLLSSKGLLAQDTIQLCISTPILNAISNTANHHFVNKHQVNNETYQSSYTYITDLRFKPLAILNLPYLERDDFLSKELHEFLERLSYAYSFILMIAIGIAFLLSKYITKSLKEISEVINQTRLEKRNEKILTDDASLELSTLINSYNSMIDQLEESVVKLAKSEREQAWREMAKQVAHEIKNPLTPMRLTVQSFQRNFAPNDPAIVEKINTYSQTLIQQIDTMSSIASAFSNFAEMPTQKNEILNVVEIVKLSLDIFNKNYIKFNADSDILIAKLDRTQLVRVITNLVKNAIQALSNTPQPAIEVHVGASQNHVVITVRDNGSGISEVNKAKIFEPKFTTKTSGMGLGLPMVKNIVETYGGQISFESEENKGSIFKIIFPKASSYDAHSFRNQQAN